MNADGVMNSVLLTSVSSEFLTCFQTDILDVKNELVIMMGIYIQVHLLNLHQESADSHSLV